MSLMDEIKSINKVKISLKEVTQFKNKILESLSISTYAEIKKDILSSLQTSESTSFSGYMHPFGLLDTDKIHVFPIDLTRRDCYTIHNPQSNQQSLLYTPNSKIQDLGKVEIQTGRLIIYMRCLMPPSNIDELKQQEIRYYTDKFDNKYLQFDVDLTVHTETCGFFNSKKKIYLSEDSQKVLQYIKKIANKDNVAIIGGTTVSQYKGKNLDGDAEYHKPKFIPEQTIVNAKDSLAYKDEVVFGYYFKM